MPLPYPLAPRESHLCPSSLPVVGLRAAGCGASNETAKNSAELNEFAGTTGGPKEISNVPTSMTNSTDHTSGNAALYRLKS